MYRTASGREEHGTLEALVSIHDVMPETRARVSEMLSRLGLPPQAVTLLVVPGREWTHSDLSWLRGLQQAGHPLAGHGWFHQCLPPKTLYHRVHSALLSRQVAEHLSYQGEGIVELVNRCHDWFADHDLEVSPLYVPPAWALGALSRVDYAALRFRYVETLTGILNTRTGRLTRLPLVGYEADNALRALFLTVFNGWNVARARGQHLPVRVGLHPFDLSLRLSSHIAVLLDQVDAFRDYSALSPVGALSRSGHLER